MKGEPMKKIGIKIALPLLLLFAAVTVLLMPRFLPTFGKAPPGSSTIISSAGSCASRTSFSAESSSVPDISSAASSGQASASASSQGSAQEEGVPAVARAASSRQQAAASAPPQTPAPAVTALMPDAPGTAVFSGQGAEMDYSNAAHGYLMVRYSGSERAKVLVYYNGGSPYYQYNISSGGRYTTLPLQSGSGSYRVRFMKNLGGDMYSEICSTTINASIRGTGCFLYPNQYVNYTRSSETVQKAKSLCRYAYSDSQKTAAIYSYITTAIRYDSAKARSVSSGYIPDVDGTLESGRGICFDYAALMAAMCRSQQIPAKLVVGNTSSGYHAWNEVYLGGWKRYDPTFGAAGQAAGAYTPQKYY